MTTSLDNLHDRFRARLPQIVTDLRALAHDHAPEALAAREAGYSIRNADTDEAVIRIYDEIWWLGVNALDLVADLDAITAPRIRVEINSPGGDVWEGVAIYNALRNHPAEIVTRIDGMAASIASVIFQAGDRRIVHASSQMMIHNAWGMTVGDHQDHADMVGILRQQDNVIAGIYAAHGDNDAEHFKALMDAETWMVGDEIVSNGLADEVVEPAAVAAMADSVSFDGSTSKPSRPKFSEHGETVLTDLAEFTTRAEEVVTFRLDQGKDPITADTSDLIARIRGEADRLAATVQPDAPRRTQTQRRALAALALHPSP